ncbi:MAG: N-6 DNA methylase [Eubacterium sp.]|nr:N-6 DNA methylase [Eubacterium sp.]
MNKSQLNESIRKFINKWLDKGKGQEDKDDRSFWIDLFQNVLDIQDATDRIDFQKRVVVKDTTKRIDAYIPETRVLIEQKSKTKKLDEKIPQGDGESLTPYEQALRYNQHLPFSEKARWIVTSNFIEIWIYDMEKNDREREPIKVSIEDLRERNKQLDFLIKEDVEEIKTEEDVSVDAGKIVGEIYDAFLKEYGDEPSEEELHELNKLCVRLVFCLYAEDAGLFEADAFYNYLSNCNVENMHLRLDKLFEVLNTPVEERRLFKSDTELEAFPYVNGELFSGDVEIPPFNNDIKELLLQKSSKEFDWSGISPTIFGAVFESTLNPETRRSGGMHYTSVENIHKVIDPLFMDELNEEFERIVNETKVPKTRIRKLEQFQDKIAGMKFLDPACGSGNFLTETYLSLRKLENKILKAIQVADKTQMEGQKGFIEVDNPIKVSINQFYGIEINDFAVTVAQTAMWIAENQMMQETSDLLMMNLDFLPLKSYTNIKEANALSIDWNDVISNRECDYIMGNPPFLGHLNVNDEQKKEMKRLFNNKQGRLDFVAAWYLIASKYIQGKKTKCAFVSTNSITQGVQVPSLWKQLIEDYEIEIIFAHQTFIWDSEASDKAHVHCVIIGFCCYKVDNKKIYSDGDVSIVNNINPYLLDAPNVIVEKRSKPICDNVPLMGKGSQFIDGGHYIFENKSERDEFVSKYPESEDYVFEYCNADGFLNNREQKYCLCLKGCPPELINSCKGIADRVNLVYEWRKNSEKEYANKLAETPTEYYVTRIPKGNSILLPIVSSERRAYIPMGFLTHKVIYTNASGYIDDATIYDFGILNSNVHMSWMVTFAGRLKSDYRYSTDIVYNTFPWPSPTDEQKKMIEKTAQGILDARKLYPNSSLADLYNKKSMPPELKSAHTKNDIAVMKAYGLDIKNTSPEDCVAKLMEMYQELSES